METLKQILLLFFWSKILMPSNSASMSTSSSSCFGSSNWNPSLISRVDILSPVLIGISLLRLPLSDFLLSSSLNLADISSIKWARLTKSFFVCFLPFLLFRAVFFAASSHCLFHFSAKLFFC
eukprot:UN27523